VDVADPVRCTVDGDRIDATGEVVREVAVAGGAVVGEQ